MSTHIELNLKDGTLLINKAEIVRVHKMKDQVIIQCWQYGNPKNAGLKSSYRDKHLTNITPLNTYEEIREMLT